MLTLAVGSLSSETWGSYLNSGEPAPNFLVESGDNQTLSLDMLRGRVVVLFYESRHVTKKNVELKNELKRLYRAQPANIQKAIFRLLVIDCSEASWPTAPVWKYKLKENSRKEGFTIYGDWNRKMFADYQMKAEESNFLIIDKQGIIRYSATGKVDKSQFEKITECLSNLVQEG
jgi:predicted transcriptional regulator